MIDLKNSAPQWIWTRGDDKNVWVWARRKFFLSRAASGSIGISADLRYLLWVNGRRIGFGPPKFHAETPTVDRYDLTDVLHAGENVIAVLVYSLGGYPLSSAMPERGALWAHFRAEETEFGTDARWKMLQDPAYLSTGARRHDCAPPSEVYDARLSIGRAELPDFDDSAWPQAAELPELSRKVLERRDIPHMTVQPLAPDRILETGLAKLDAPYAGFSAELLTHRLAVARLEPDRGHRIVRTEGCCVPLRFDAANLPPEESLYALFDLGRVWAGYPALEISGTAGTIVDIHYAEDLRFNRIRSGKIRAYIDRVILGGERHRHRVTWPKSARYLQVNVHGGRATLHDIAFERSNYPVERQGFFASDDAVLNQAVEISLHTVQLCMEDTYMDTPWRERGAWLGDDLVKAQAAYAYFGDWRLARRFLLHHRRGQKPNGMLMGKYPANVPIGVSTWTLFFPLSLREYCMESGDWEFAKTCLETLEGIYRWLETMRQPGGLYQAPPAKVNLWDNDYNFIDWAPLDMRGINAAWNAFAYEALRTTALLASRCHAAAFAAKAEKRADALKQAFQRGFWNESNGAFANGLLDGKLINRWGCHENLLALLFGLAGETQRARLMARLSEEGFDQVFVEDPKDYDVDVPECGKIPTVSLALSTYRWPAEKMVPVGTPWFAGYLLEALIKMGRVAEAQAFIRDKWGEFSRQGGTTVWETWNMEQSLSHAWSCPPAVIASRYFLGVHRADEKTLRILPIAGTLTQARGRVMSRHGVLQVEWKRKPHWELRLDLPKGASYLAGLPVEKSSQLELNGTTLESPHKIRYCGLVFQCVELKGGQHQLRHIPQPMPHTILFEADNMAVSLGV